MSILRRNMFELVKHGFSRDELYRISINEYLDYVKILNEEIERKNRELSFIN